MRAYQLVLWIHRLLFGSSDPPFSSPHAMPSTQIEAQIQLVRRRREHKTHGTSDRTRRSVPQFSTSPFRAQYRSLVLGPVSAPKQSTRRPAVVVHAPASTTREQTEPSRDQF